VELLQHDHAAANLEAMLRKYLRLRALPDHELRVLGYFSILESLITHKPVDSMDSLVRRVSGKMALLSNRFKRPLPYDGLAGSPTPQKAWTSLYEYRSNLAHGQIADFKSKKLRFLRSPRSAASGARRLHVLVVHFFALLHVSRKAAG
jgi:hypothetical protein